MQAKAMQCASEERRIAEETPGRIRAHDAWGLDLPVLMDAMNTRAVEYDLGKGSMHAALGVITGQLFILVRPGLTDTQVAFAIRSLLAHYIHRPYPVLRFWAATQGQGARVEEVDDLPDSVPAEPPEVTVDVLDLFGDGHWAPKDGWRPDEEVLAELKDIAVLGLKGVVEDIPVDRYPLPAGLGAVMTISEDNDGAPHPLVYLRGDLPTGLLVDLLGFCIALGSGAEYGDWEPDENGLIFVGTEAGPVRGPGAALLGALMVQRLGRRPGDCAFTLLAPPTEGSASAPELAA
ncbi:hypothetical protein [Streptomyces sp. VRA16 Mangrove soil]|uniref:hypothetical protein n=1 Tax=Streptomyces sp. VRA16 Mangrove soil TaxID=2817434 RepID=UPI001A9F76E8|nr:hypothetical protein [Streptomyces sp. VRA16 Mangrove soil]MBO1333728.1 hypothetical protein [Streptomyces sp. VRA16 Mangrove soil]